MSSRVELFVLRLAIVSATCGCLASVCGKLAFDTSENNLLRTNSIDSYIVRGVLGISIILLNSTMLSFYVRVLQSVSALQASLLAFVCNYVVSTFFGIVLFGESVSGQWLLGAVVMIAGAFRATTIPTTGNDRNNKIK